MEIICYLSNGYPTIEASYNMAVEYADAGCRMMEVDFPSRNPYLESDYIAGRMKKALEACDDYEKYMDSIVAIQKRLPDVKILVLAYENTVEEIGVDRFIEFCLTNNLKDNCSGASGILLCTVSFTERRSGNGKTIKWICIFTGEAV